MFEAYCNLYSINNYTFLKNGKLQLSMGKSNYVEIDKDLAKKLVLELLYGAVS